MVFTNTDRLMPNGKPADAAGHYRYLSYGSDTGDGHDRTDIPALRQLVRDRMEAKLREVYPEIAAGKNKMHLLLCSGILYFDNFLPFALWRSNFAAPPEQWPAALIYSPSTTEPIFYSIAVYIRGDDRSMNILMKFLFDPVKIDVVILSHAHIDHCGRLPKLYKDGFGEKYSTPATEDPDGDTVTRQRAYYRSVKSEFTNRHHKTGTDREALYTADDVARTMELFQNGAL